MKKYLPFCTEFSILCIRYIVIADRVLNDSAFWWLASLTHKLFWSWYSLIINLIGLACHMVWYIQYLWWHVVEWAREKQGSRWRTRWGCVEERFQQAMVKLNRNGKGSRKVVGMEDCSINILDPSELELAWSWKSSSYFEKKFLICLLFGILYTSMFKVHDVLHWLDFLVMKTSDIFRSTFWIHFISHLLSIIANKLYLH